jgi:hypothetical protein
MGKFLSTSYRDTVENITEFYEDLVNNPFYKFNDSKPSFVTYYNIDKLHSSVDPGSKLQYDNIGEETPMRFNRIYNFALYGIDKIELQSEIGEFGLEDNTIEGEAFILPNTIIPYEGDYFEISHVHDSTWLFIVKDVQKDTLDNGSNAYKISYKLEYDDNSKIQKNIQANYELIEKNEGTNVVVVARCEDVDIARKLDAQATKLKSYYQDLFYNERVQTFIYQNFMQYRVYDPFLIEFLIRNRVLDNGEEDYIYVCHQIPIPKTFAIDYDKTFLRAIELKDHKKIRRYLYKTTLMPIKAYGTTFYGRYEGYFTSKYDDLDVPEGTNNCFDEDLMDHIVDHKLYEDIPNYDDDFYWKNIIVKYFYMDPLDDKEIEDIDNIKFEDPIYMFYMIPVLIYCLEKYIEYVLK